MPANQEAQQEAAKASDKLSCRTRLMGPLLVLGALVAQAKPAVAQMINDPVYGRVPARLDTSRINPGAGGSCPAGWFRDGPMCIRDPRVAFFTTTPNPRDGSCYAGWVRDGSRCVQRR